VVLSRHLEWIRVWLMGSDLTEILRDSSRSAPFSFEGAAEYLGTTRGGYMSGLILCPSKEGWAVVRVFGVAVVALSFA